MYKKFVDFVRSIYETNDFIPLHAPVFNGEEKKYLSTDEIYFLNNWDAEKYRKTI